MSKIICKIFLCLSMVPLNAAPFDFITDRFKSTQVTRAVDYHAQLAALLSYEQILNASEATALGAMDAASATAKAALSLSQSFLDQVVQKAAVGVLDGPAQAAKGILTAAEKSGVFIIEGGKIIVGSIVDQVDVTCIHYDGDLQSMATLKLGDVIVQGKAINPFNFKISLDLNDPIGSMKIAAQKIAEALQHNVADKVSKSLGMPIADQIKIVKNNDAAIQQKATQIAAIKEPEDLKAAQIQMQKNIGDVDTIRESQKEIIEKQIEAQKLDSQKDSDVTAAIYDPLLKEMQLLRLCNPHKVAFFR